MASPFNISAALSIQGKVGGLDQARQQVTKAFSGFAIDIPIRVDTTSLNAAVSRLASLQANLSSAAAAAGTLGTGLNNVSSTSAGQKLRAVGDGAAQAQAQMRGLKAEVIAGTDSLGNFAAQAGLALRRFAAFSIGTAAIVGLVAAVKGGIGNALEFERSLVRVGQVGGESKDQLNSLGNSIGNIAVKYGASNRELAETAVNLRKAGLAGKELTEALDAVAQASLSPHFASMASAGETLISVMHQFGQSAEEAKETLGGVVAVANKFAVTGGEIESAISKAGGAFKNIGGSAQELIAIFSTVRNTTRESAEGIATGLRTIFTRFQRPETLDALRALRIELRYTHDEAVALNDTGLEGQFVGANNALQRLSSGLKDLRSTDSRFASITETLGGYREISKILPLLSQYGDIQKALGVAQTGGIAATLAAEKAQTSLLFRITQLGAEFNKLMNSVTNSSGFQTLADSAINASKSILSVLDAIKPLLPVVAALGIGKALTGLGNIGTRFAGSLLGGPGAVRREMGGTIPCYGDGNSVHGHSSIHIRDGLVPGVGSTDSVPANLLQGSFVVKQSSVRSLGAANLDRMGFSKGGKVASLLTPQEYIFNPERASKIGLAELTKMNATGRRFAHGGYVGYATGGRKEFDVPEGSRIAEFGDLDKEAQSVVRNLVNVATGIAGSGDRLARGFLIVQDAMGKVAGLTPQYLAGLDKEKEAKAKIKASAPSADDWKKIIASDASLSPEDQKKAAAVNAKIIQRAGGDEDAAQEARIALAGAAKKGKDVTENYAGSVTYHAKLKAARDKSLNIGKSLTASAYYEDTTPGREKEPDQRLIAQEENALLAQINAAATKRALEADKLKPKQIQQLAEQQGISLNTKAPRSKQAKELLAKLAVSGEGQAGEPVTPLAVAAEKAASVQAITKPAGGGSGKPPISIAIAGGAADEPRKGKTFGELINGRPDGPYPPKNETQEQTFARFAQEAAAQRATRFSTKVVKGEIDPSIESVVASHTAFSANASNQARAKDATEDGLALSLIASGKANKDKAHATIQEQTAKEDAAALTLIAAGKANKDKAHALIVAKQQKEDAQALPLIAQVGQNRDVAHQAIRDQYDTEESQAKDIQASGLKKTEGAYGLAQQRERDLQGRREAKQRQEERLGRLAFNEPPDRPLTPEERAKREARLGAKAFSTIDPFLQKKYDREDLAASRREARATLGTEDAKFTPVNAQDLIRRRVADATNKDIEARGGRQAVSRQTQAELEAKNQKNIERQVAIELESAQRNLNRGPFLEGHFASQERNRLASETAGDVLSGGKLAAVDANDNILGEYEAVKAAQQQGKAIPGAGGTRFGLRRGINAAYTGLGKANDYLRNRIGNAGQLSIFAAPFLASQVEESAGSPELAAEGDGSSYKSKKGAAGGIQGALFGGIIGGSVGGPIGAAIGGVVGGLFSLVSSLKTAEHDLSQVRLAKTLQTLSDHIEAIRVNGFDKSGASIAAASEDIQIVGRGITKNANEAASNFGFREIASPFRSTFNPETFNATLSKEQHEKLGPQVQGFRDLLYEQFKEVSKKSPLAKPDDIINQVRTSGGGFGNQLISAITAGGGPGSTTLLAQAKKDIVSFQNQARIENDARASGRGETRDISTFGRIASSLEAASSGLEELKRSAQLLSNAFDGTYQASKVSANLDSFGHFGRSDAGNSRVLGLISATTGSAGHPLEEAGRTAERLANVLPTILSDAASRNPKEQKDFSQEVREKIIAALGDTDEARKAANSVTHKINSIAEASGGSPKAVIENLQTDATKFANDLASAYIEPIKEAGLRSGKIIEDTANHLVEGLTRYRQQQLTVGEFSDRSGQISANRQIGEIEIRAAQNGRRLQGPDLVPLSVLQAPFLEKQARLAGKGDGLDAGDIASRLRDAQRDVAEAEKNQQRVFEAKGPASPQFAAAAKSLSELQLKADKLGLALKNLADGAGLAAGYQRKLATIQEERQNRQGLSSSFYGGGSEAQIALTRGGLLALEASKSGRGPNTFLSSDVDLIDKFHAATSKIPLAAFGGRLGGDLAEEFHARGAFGGLPKDKQDEERSIQEKLLAMLGKQDEAGKALVENQKSLASSFFTNLVLQNETFLAKLGASLAKDRLVDNTNKTADTKEEKRKLDAQVGLKGELSLGGVKTTADLERAQKALPNIEKFFNEGKLIDQEHARLSTLAQGTQGKDFDELYDVGTPGGQELKVPFKGRDHLDTVVGGNQNAVQEFYLRHGLSDEQAKLASAYFTNLTDPRTGGQYTKDGKNPQYAKPGDADYDKINKQILREKAFEAAENILTTEQDASDPGQSDRTIKRSVLATALKKQQYLKDQLTEQGLRPNALNNVDPLKFKEALSTFNNKDNTLEGLPGKLDKVSESLARLKEQADDFQKTIKAGDRKATDKEIISGSLISGLGLGFALGGWVPNQGPDSFQPAKGTDTVRAMLTPGERVVRRQSAMANAGLLDAINNSNGPLNLDMGGIAYYAGGAVVNAEAQRQFRLQQENDAAQLDPNQRHRELAGVDDPLLQKIQLQQRLKRAAELGAAQRKRDADVADFEENNPVAIEAAANSGGASALALRRAGREKLLAPLNDFRRQDAADAAILKRVQNAELIEGRGADVDPRARIGLKDLNRREGGIRQQLQPGEDFEAGKKRLRQERADFLAGGLDSLDANLQSLSGLKEEQTLAQSDPLAAFGLGRADYAGQRSIGIDSLRSRADTNTRARSLDFDFAYRAQARQHRLRPQTIGVPIIYRSSGGSVGSDNVPAWLSSGEEVLSRSAVQRLGGQHAAEMLNRGGVPRFEEGGYVTAAGLAGGASGASASNYAAPPSFQNSVGSANGVSPSILTALGAGLTSFITPAVALVSSLNSWGSASEALTKALSSFPNTVKLQGSFTHDVNLNGAETLGAIQGQLKEMVETAVRTQVVKTLQKSLPDAGITDA